MSLFELIKQGGVSLVPLGICSLLALTVILERLWTFSRIGNMPADLFLRVERALATRNLHEAMRLLEASTSPFARIARASLAKPDADAGVTCDILTMACETEVAHATRPLPVLGTIGNIAPFIGLFGTVLGIMRAFKDVAAQGSSNSAVVSQGIAEALIATGVGLGIGIIAVVANNWFGAWVDNYRRELDHFATKWSHTLGERCRACPQDMREDVAPLLNDLAKPMEPVV